MRWVGCSAKPEKSAPRYPSLIVSVASGSGDVSVDALLITEAASGSSQASTLQFVALFGDVTEFMELPERLSVRYV